MAVKRWDKFTIETEKSPSALQRGRAFIHHGKAGQGEMGQATSKSIPALFSPKLHETSLHIGTAKSFLQLIRPRRRQIEI